MEKKAFQPRSPAVAMRTQSRSFSCCRIHCAIHIVAILLSTTKNVKGWSACSRKCMGSSVINSHSRLRARTPRRRGDRFVDNRCYYENEPKDYWDEGQPFSVRKDRSHQKEWEEEDRSSSSGDKPGPYNLYFSGTEYEEDDEITWELCDDMSTWVLLPPSYVDTPTAVLHFVGGTFFGSSPKLWYRTLLEGIVRATKCTVVATPIPVTLMANPLRHVSLSRKLQRQFQSAYINVLSDEYEAEALAQVPVVGIGHSLGSRLLTVLATLPDKRSIMVPPYTSYILMSFNNFGASASVPGIQSLLKQSRSLEDYSTESKRRRKRKRRRERGYDEYFFDDDDDDEEWDEMLNELQGALKEQADKVKNALTPSSEELEFDPTPDQLWEAVKTDKQYRVSQTLVIHFDEDEVDQSPRLADCLMQSETSDVKYAWLRGNHLTPISAEGEQGWSQWLKFPSGASKALSKIVYGSSGSGASDAMRDLRQSIARYITDVVTK